MFLCVDGDSHGFTGSSFIRFDIWRTCSVPTDLRRSRTVRLMAFKLPRGTAMNSRDQEV